VTTVEYFKTAISTAAGCR